MLSSDLGESNQNGWLTGVWFQPKRFAVWLALLVVGAFPDVIFGGGTFFYRDFGIFGYPIAFHHRESFWSGEIPLWNPYNNCGVPFLAQWNTMTLYPLSLFYLVFPLSWSLGVFCLLHLYLAGIGMYFLARQWTGQGFPAALAGIAFAFNGLTLSCLKWPNNIAALAWMPWVVLLVERGWRRGGRSIILAGIAGATQMLSGGPEIILFTWVLLAILWLNELVNRFRPARRATATSHAAVAMSELTIRFLSMIGLVAGLSAAQLLPFLDLLLHSQRGASYSDASWAMPIWGWANFLVPLFGCFPSHQGVFAQPGQYWISSYYAGIGVIAFTAMALWPRPSGRAGLLALVAGVSLVLALGPAGYLYAWIRALCPLLEIVRFPIKFVVVANCILPVLGAFGVARWVGLGTTSKDRPFLTIGVVLLLFIALIVGLAHWAPWPTDDWTSTWHSGLSRGLFLILILAAMATMIRARHSLVCTILALGLLVLHWLDVMTHAPRLSPTIERWVYEPGLARKELKLTPEPARGNSRAMLSPYADFKLNHLALTNAVEDFLYSRMSLFANVNLLDRIPKVDGFYSLSIREENEIRSLIYAATNVSWPRLEKFLGAAQVSADEKPIQWNARSNFLALATAGQRPIFAEESAVRGGLAGASFDPARSVYLPVEAQAFGSAANGAKAELRLTRFDAHLIDLEIEATDDTWVVLAQTFYHPWKAYIDGQAARLWRANHAFQAVATPVGRHAIKLVYEDRIFRIGTVISVLSLLVCAAGWFRAAPRNGQPRSHERSYRIRENSSDNGK